MLANHLETEHRGPVPSLSHQFFKKERKKKRKREEGKKILSVIFSFGKHSLIGSQH